MIRKLSVGDTLNEVFALYGAHAGVLLPIAFWIFLVVAIVDGLAGANLALFPLVIVVSTIAGTLYRESSSASSATFRTAAATPRWETSSTRRCRSSCR